MSSIQHCTGDSIQSRMINTRKKEREKQIRGKKKEEEEEAGEGEQKGKRRVDTPAERNNQWHTDWKVKSKTNSLPTI